MENDVSALLDSAAVARWLGVTVPALEQRRRRGASPPFLKLGRVVRYRVRDVEDWLAKAETQAAKA